MRGGGPVSVICLPPKPANCRESRDHRCFVTFIFLSFLFFPHESLIGLCFFFCPPLMWSLYAQFKEETKKKMGLETFFSGGGVNVVGHRNYYLQL